MTADELKVLIAKGEVDRVERTRSTTDTNKFREAICAFSNDLPGYGKPGYLLIGVNDDGSSSGLVATDELLKLFASYRDDGQILPQPMVNVSHQSHPDGSGDVIVIEVRPHDLPPVRFKGRTYVRVGPRKATASEAEERVLIERRSSHFPTEAVRELLMNAVVHRDYQSTSPVRFYQFSDRIEIQNPGGLYGEASPENFPRVNAYRNPIVAEAMHVLGYVNRFGRGIARAKRAQLENGSAEPAFDFQTSHFLAIIPKHPQR